MSKFQELEAEFGEVKQYSVQELPADNFARRATQNTTRVKRENLNYTFNLKMKTPLRRAPQNGESTHGEEDNVNGKISLAGEAANGATATNQLTPPRRKILLIGQDQLAQFLAEKRERRKRKASSTPPATRRKVLLIPMDDAYRQKALSILERRKRAGLTELDSLDAENRPTHTQSFREVVVSLDGEGLDEDNEIARQLASSQKEESGTLFVDPSGRESSEEPFETAIDLQEVVEDGPMNGAGKELVVQPQEVADLLRFRAETQSLEDIIRMKNIILQQLSGNHFPQLKTSSLSSAYEEIYTLFSHTINDSESHTALLIGPRGSGKTTIVDKALGELQGLHGDNFIVIKLSGSFLADDLYAIREIARQLDAKIKTSETEKKSTFEQRAISDTFTNILLTLSKPADTPGYHESAESPIRIIFVLDEIEEFTRSAKQVLLYNLFELTQTLKVPICLLGVTTRLTIRELFEKRVRSRFSQRIVLTKKASSVEEFWDNAKLGLTVAPQNFLQFTDQEYPAQWNDKIEEMFQTGTGLTHAVYSNYYLTKNQHQMNFSFVMPVSQITPEQPFPRPLDFVVYEKNAIGGVKGIIESLSTAELMLVMAAARFIERAAAPHVNFRLAHQEYMEMVAAQNTEATTLLSKTSYIDNMSLASIKVTRNVLSRTVLRDCWCKVYRTGLLFDVISTNNDANAHNDLNMYKESIVDDSKMLQLDVTLEELGTLLPEDSPCRRFSKL